MSLNGEARSFRIMKGESITRFEMAAWIKEVAENKIGRRDILLTVQRMLYLGTRNSSTTNTTRHWLLSSKWLKFEELVPEAHDFWWLVLLID